MAYEIKLSDSSNIIIRNVELFIVIHNLFGVTVDCEPFNKSKTRLSISVTNRMSYPK